MSAAAIRVSSSADPEGFTIDIRKLRRVLQNNRAYVLIFGNIDRDFLIVPKSAFDDAARAAFETLIRDSSTKP